MTEVIVIGGGPAGVTAALRACELGASVQLIERGRMGGTCTNDGCVPTRVLAKAARLARDAEQFPIYGLSTASPVVDLEALIGHTQQIVFGLHEKKQLLDHLEQAGAEVYANVGSVRFVDAHTIEMADGRQLRADRIILCTGGHARRLQFPGSENALTHSDVWSLKKLPESMVIVGAAATGCQLASIFAAFGTRVLLMDVAPAILPAEDEDVRQLMGEAFRRRGIEILAPIEVIEGIEHGADGLTLHFRSEGRAETLTVETIVMAVGWIGNLEGLGLEAAGVRHERGYIVVDDQLRTSVEHIFAAGDVIGQTMLVQSATYEGRVAAENAILGGESSYRHQIVPHGGFTDPEYGSVGLTEHQARLSHDCAVATVPYSDLDRAVIDGRPEGFCKLIVARDSGRLLGAHVVGEQALEVVQVAAAGMTANVHIADLARLQLAYPTYTAIVGLVARRLVRELGLTPLAPEWRALRRVRDQVTEWERRAAL